LPDAHLMTDKHKKFREIGKRFISHEVALRQPGDLIEREWLTIP